MKCLLFLLIATTAAGQNLIPTNSGAESGTLSGWVSQTTYLGAARAADPLNSVSINTNLNLVSEGTRSFWLHDGSTSNSQALFSAAGNRALMVSNTHYQISFDVQMLSAANPFVQLQFFTTPTGNTFGLQQVCQLRNPGPIATATTLTNGFTRYVIDEYLQYGGSSSPVYCGIQFFTDFYDTSTSDMYVDNLSVQLIPQPTQLTAVPSKANVILAWPTNATGLKLYATTDPAFTNWTAVSKTPTFVNGHNEVTDSASGTQKFYRLSP